MCTNIGIFTLHSNTNFGGGLQQIALFEVLKSWGYNPQVVCVCNDVPMTVRRRILGILSMYGFWGILKELKERYTKKRHISKGNYDLYDRCDAFNYTNLNYTPKFGMGELPEYCKRYDTIIVGSDQVWTDVYSAVLPYFFDGVGDYHGKRIAYAACSAHDSVPFFNRKHIKYLLGKFDGISVRDYTTVNLVESILHNRPVIVADPTLLYDYDKYIKPVRYKEPYIFAYVLGEKSAEWHAANIAHIRKQVGNIKVIALTVELNEQIPWADEVLCGELSVDWMNLLRCSSFVYTNSFHAVLFSLKFHREFIAYYGDLLRSTRMIGLQGQFSLSDRIVQNPLNCNLSKKIDFANTDKIINVLKQHSLSWLKERL